MFFKFSIKKFLGALFFVIFAVHFLAVFYNLYYKIVWLDVVLHFLGGLWLGVAAYYILYESKRWQVSQPYIISFLFILGFAAIFGILWEFFEFSLDRLFLLDLSPPRPAQLGLVDTLTDLFFDLAGGMLGALYFLKKSR